MNMDRAEELFGLMKSVSLVGLARSTIYAKVSAGSFPHPNSAGVSFCRLAAQLTLISLADVAPERKWDPAEVK